MGKLPVKKDNSDQPFIMTRLFRNRTKWVGNPGREFFQDNLQVDTIKPLLTTRGVFINCVI